MVFVYDFQIGQMYWTLNRFHLPDHLKNVREGASQLQVIFSSLPGGSIIETSHYHVWIIIHVENDPWSAVLLGGIHNAVEM